jgi:hypothetical protein
LNILQGELLEPENKSDMLTPVQIELIDNLHTVMYSQDKKLKYRVNC